VRVPCCMEDLLGKVNVFDVDIILLLATDAQLGLGRCRLLLERCVPKKKREC